MRDLEIGRNPIELNALLSARVRAFVVERGDWPDSENAKTIIGALPNILRLLRENKFPFIAKVRRDHSVLLWKTEFVKIPRHRRGSHR